MIFLIFCNAVPIFLVTYLPILHVYFDKKLTASELLSWRGSDLTFGLSFLACVCSNPKYYVILEEIVVIYANITEKQTNLLYLQFDCI